MFLPNSRPARKCQEIIRQGSNCSTSWVHMWPDFFLPEIKMSVNIVTFLFISTSCHFQMWQAGFFLSLFPLFSLPRRCSLGSSYNLSSPTKRLLIEEERLHDEPKEHLQGRLFPFFVYRFFLLGFLGSNFSVWYTLLWFNFTFRLNFIFHCLLNQG